MFDERVAAEGATRFYRPPQGYVRWRLILSWDGAAFVGWQSQPGARSVQDTLRDAVLPLVGSEAEVARPVAAGRTDAGVHAEAMTAHLDVRLGSFKPGPAQLARAINASLPPDLAVSAIEPAAPGFHARFSCTERAYVYRVLNEPQRRPLWAGRALHRSGPLDLNAMRRAAALLTGLHDFAAFATQEERQTVRDLRRLDVRRMGELTEFHVAGESFLRHMVRGLVGTLLKVGEGRLDPAQVAAILASRQRAQAGANVPPHGLYFAGAEYGERRQHRSGG
ncbi:tRNA pseudouridine(38-40) synthase TruA [Deinococcus alpinitundrae]|uniref:tRNA pseudouridine(38-40) synthase TruA n=1 Tax=Deinococcus alpinitundrae TaxID=468913 RepID=UPI001ED95DF9|nr:tRNA pseudouridine(38-40) synthase TruA [Deinococcus alpinitundrae]